MILFLVLNLLNYCLLIIPEKIEISSFSNEERPLENCPCDLTYNTCDRNCECDEKCNTIDGGYDAYNEYKKPGNHIFKKKYQKLLPMCSDLDKSPITDLYSPLTIGYQILKKGLCLFNKDAVKYDDDNLHYDDSIDEIIEKLDLDNDIDDSDSLNNEKPKKISDDSSSYEIYYNLEIEFPIMLPDGSCLKNNYIKFLQDKKVICYDKIEELSSLINDLKTNFTNKYLEYIIENEKYLLERTDKIDNNSIIKKFLFEFSVYKDKEKKIHKLVDKNITFIYCQKDSNFNDSYKEVIYEVKFNYDDSFDKIKSGNPGYIKGKPLLTKLLANRIFFGVDSNGYCKKKEESDQDSFIYYEDDIIENTFTFEDNIIYGCKYNGNINNKELYLYENIFPKKDYSFYPLGNPYLKYNDNSFISSKCVKKNNENEEEFQRKISNNNILSLDILYEAINTKNNTQNRLLKINCYYDYDDPQSQIEKDNEITYKYIKVNAFKVKSETEWWHAPGWKISFPKNIMYPFRIGTTSYEEK